MENGNIILRKDNEWSFIDGELCRVVDFTPMATIENGKILTIDKSMPYACVTLECKKISGIFKAYITHKMDFEHLWSAFKEKTIKQNVEVLFIWSKKHFKGYAKIFSAFMPRLWVMICPKDAFELMTDQNYKPELKGEARFLAERPIIDWKPEVMK